MKIISKHKDYYDGICQSLGIDDHIIYIRDNEDIEEYFNYYLPYTSERNTDKKSKITAIDYNFRIIGAAGKLYPLLKITTHEFNKVGVVEYVYDIDKIKKEHNILWNPKDKWRRKHNNWNNFIDLLNNKTILNYFHKFKVGSFILGKKDLYQHWTMKPVYNLELEPMLKDLEFYKCVDPFTLFNEMSMFISEQLNTEIDNHPMSDIQKVKSKGFDDKYGFRTRPKK